MKPITQTKVTVNDHAAFTQSLYRPAEIKSISQKFDEVDHLTAAPIQARSEKEVSKLLQLLDEIQVETLRENSFEREASK